MLATNYVFFTSKINKKNINSYTIMINAGMIKQLSSGIYYWLPTGLKVLKNIENIVRNTMNKINAIEILIPILQNVCIWEQSNRIKDYGAELFNITDRKQHNLVLSPTNEEAITYCLKNVIKSYKELPIHIYQIQTKFRDEIRPRLGIIRAKEFIMKDSYSFHINRISLQETYNMMLTTYKKIFDILKLEYIIIQAENSIIGGNISHEFHLFANNGENTLALTQCHKYISNIELATYFLPKKNKINIKKFIKKINITSTKSLLNICRKYNIDQNNIIKIIIIQIINVKNKFIIIFIKQNYTFNIYKFIKISKEKIENLKILSEQETKQYNLFDMIKLQNNVSIIADYSVINMYNFIINIYQNQYIIYANWYRDIPYPTNIQDIRYVTQNDLAPNGKDYLIIKRSIEIAHIFQLDKKYSQSMNLYINNINGIKKYLYMGCYGIGISRIIAAIIEQHHDAKGIIWPTTLIAPFKIAIIPINMHAIDAVKDIAYFLYKKFTKLNKETLLDNRKENPGKMLTDIDLIGIPHIIIINIKNLKNNHVEYKYRNTEEKFLISLNNIISFIMNKNN
ncbi:proline--tRNA ligase [Enterobacteriaceae endosymbiont of Neohaemonia nigricornis]|uniref:proline--tRNA ligase n=1 Tax=Enterobacteriaceae endosymbiont of Neohaemonia nigricornis TaxID=2675792 RepID=UPI0014490B11|nr:proline--tRNA ligase [Enterobacteriaceae endosymbiont of Neohaemonia nigricornis]QJC30414.1 proline--tRNA ligase [Enterobacteriaceae endosymbiont of Neohaemonia nigricornis]